MKFNDHGAETNNIYKQFKIDKPEMVIDFSTNTNVLNISHDVSLSLKNIDYSSYPDINNTDLISSVISHISKQSGQNIKEENLLVTNGSNEAIYIIASYFMNEKVAIYQPTYPEYEKAFLAYNAQVDHCFDINDLVNNDYKCFVICNPNNPTGAYISWSKLEIVINKLTKQGTTVVVDEAYIDFLLKEDDSSDCKYDIFQTSNVIILRSLTKIYQIAGLRLAYVMGNKYWINKIKERQPSWSVNSLASLIGQELLNKDGIVEQTKIFYKEEVKRVISKLSILGYEVVETTTNFYLLKIENDVKIIEYLLRRGIIVRHTRNHPGLDGGYVRIAVRSKADNSYLLEVLEDYKLL